MASGSAGLVCIFHLKWMYANEYIFMKTSMRSLTLISDILQKLCKAESGPLTLHNCYSVDIMCGVRKLENKGKQYLKDI